MAVKDVFAQGGRLPQPDDEDRVGKGRRERDEVDEIMEAALKGEKVKTFRQAAGYNEEKRVTTVEKPPDERVNLNIGEIFTAQSNILNTLLSKLVEITQRSPTAAKDPFIEHLNDELRDMRSRLDVNPPDPIQSLLDNQERLEKVMGGLKGRLGIPDNMTPRVGDMTVMLELEKIRIEAQDRSVHQSQEFQFAMKKLDADLRERERRWAIEDRQWAEDYKLRSRSADATRAQEEKKNSAFQDLALSVVDAINAEKGQPRQETPQPAARSAQVDGAAEVDGAVKDNELPAIRPRQFKCASCEGMIPVPKDATEVTCPECGSIYDMEAV